jgi:tripartite-type tricarboxylate transporter receptor subunit TctC
MTDISHTRRACLQAGGRLVTLATAAALLRPGLARASTDWPNKPITLLVHTAPGSAADSYARNLAKALEPVLGQPVAVLNRVGGNGVVQMSALSAAAADGYTLAVNTASHLSILRTTARATFSLSDFDWIARVQLETYLTVVRADAPWQSLGEFVEAARKAHPLFNVGGQGAPGSAHNIHFNILAQAGGFKFNWIPFQGGIQHLTALLGGTLTATSNNPQTILQFAEANRVRPLGVQGLRRVDSFPQVQTYREAGIDADPSWQQVRGVIARKGTPLEIRQKLEAAIKTAIESPDWKAYMRSSGLQDGFQGNEEYTASIQQLDQITAHWLGQLGLLK